MIENETAKLEKPPISRKSCCAYPRRSRSRTSLRMTASMASWRFNAVSIGFQEAGRNRGISSITEMPRQRHVHVIVVSCVERTLRTLPIADSEIHGFARDRGCPGQ